MFIQSVKTPNPDAVKFFPGGVVMSEGVCEFLDIESAGASPMAVDLLAIDGVLRVFYGHDFVLVTKLSEVEWSAVKPQVIMTILSHYKEGGTLFCKQDEQNEPCIIDIGEKFAQDDPVALQIISLLRKYVLPRLAMDGGHVEFRGYKDGIVYLKMRGACTSCPSADMTLKHGIKSLLVAYIEGVKEVEAVVDA